MISVVVPVLDDEDEVAGCVRSLARTTLPTEVLVVDGGSRDRSCKVAEGAGARVITSRPGRARQMNRGAEAAEGDVLLFMHADMRLPDGGIERVAAAMADPTVPGGGFFKRYHPSSPLLAALALGHNHLRAAWFRDLVGTNAIFVRRQVFEALGGFPEVPFLEDVLFSDRLKQLGRVAVIRDPVEVSARKYRREGTLARTLRNVWIMVQFRVLGRTPEQLVAQYRGG